MWTLFGLDRISHTTRRLVSSPIEAAFGTFLKEKNNIFPPPHFIPSPSAIFQNFQKILSHHHGYFISGFGGFSPVGLRNFEKKGRSGVGEEGGLRRGATFKS